jgi:hypothetical protein
VKALQICMALALPCLVACAPAFDAYADTVIAADQVKRSVHDRIGYTAALEKMETAGVRPSSDGGSAMVRQMEQEETYRRMRNQDLIMQHGAGGCTPNFATGGCL